MHNLGHAICPAWRCSLTRDLQTKYAKQDQVYMKIFILGLGLNSSLKYAMTIAINPFAFCLVKHSHPARTSWFCDLERFGGGNRGEAFFCNVMDNTSKKSVEVVK